MENFTRFFIRQFVSVNKDDLPFDYIYSFIDENNMHLYENQHLENEQGNKIKGILINSFIKSVEDTLEIIEEEHEEVFLIESGDLLVVEKLFQKVYRKDFIHRYTYRRISDDQRIRKCTIESTLCFLNKLPNNQFKTIDLAGCP